MLIIAGSTTNIENGEFKNNLGGNSGGAIYHDRDSQLTITDTLFQANQAQGLLDGGGGYGGAIANEGTLRVANGYFAANSSKLGGGGIQSNVGDAVINGSFVTNNSSGNGGGIVAYSGALTVTDTAIDGNTATVFGGGLLNDTAQAVLTRVKLTNNQARYGGGFSNNNSVGRVSLEGSTIQGNTAEEGGAYVNFGTVDLHNSAVCGAYINHLTVNDQGGNTASCGR